MKVILSRKGFDSTYGGFPSPILPNNIPLSLPIPSIIDSVRYEDLHVGTLTLFYLMKQLKNKIKINGKWKELNVNMTCHLDPDIYEFFMKRPKNWKPLFGQIGAAQSHLENQGIKEGDIFLFFGWFRKTKFQHGKLVFDPKEKDKHVIFGYFQIGEIVKITENESLLFGNPEWVKYHPHFHPERRKKTNNTIYIARETLSWNKKLPGAGIFSYSKDLVLTKEGYSKSIWKLPEFFKEVKISYHSKNAWREDGTFKSIGRGQEFVVEENDKVEKWVKNLIENNYCKLADFFISLRP
jgi:hypothetical protein